MKTKILLLITIIFFAISCEKKQYKFDILYNPELDYYTKDEVDTPAKFSGDEWKEENSKILSVAKEIKNSNKNFPDKIAIYFRVFISSEGKLVALKNLKRPAEENADIINELIEKVGIIFSENKITPAQKSGQAVNFMTDGKLGFENVNDTLRLFIPDFVNMNSNMPLFNYDSSIEKDFFTAVEQMPEPIGGISAIANNVKYPEIAKRAGIEGRVFVKALIDEKGSVVGTQIIRGIGAGCDEAAMSAIMNTRFKPGIQRGKAVKVQISIPIVFKLQ